MRFVLAAVSVFLLAAFNSGVDSYRMFDVQNDAEFYETDIAREEQGGPGGYFIPEQNAPEMDIVAKKFGDSLDRMESGLKKISELQDSNKKKIAELEEKNIKMQMELRKAHNEFFIRTTAIKQQQVAPVKLETYQPQPTNYYTEKASSFWDWICATAKRVVGKVLNFFGVKF